jgi:hypothetical protein
MGRREIPTRVFIRDSALSCGSRERSERMGRGGFEPPALWRLCQQRGKPMTQSLEPIVPEEAVEQYLKSRGQDASESTIQNHRYRLKHLLKWCDQASIENLNELSGRDCENYKNWRIAQGDVADITLEQQLRTFRVFLRYCESIEGEVRGERIGVRECGHFTPPLCYLAGHQSRYTGCFPYTPSLVQPLYITL